MHHAGYLLISNQEFREFHAAWLKREEEEQRGIAVVQEPRGEGEKDAVAVAEVETPVAKFALRDLHITIDIGIPPPGLHGIDPRSMLQDVVGAPSDAFTDDRVVMVPSPTLSISTVSDWTSTGLGEDIGECSVEQKLTRHKTFYFDDGNVEIVCGNTVFRVHSTTISFSSSKLRDMLSPSALLNAPMQEGYPRIVFTDSAQDFGVLMKMIHDPGWVAPSLGGGLGD